MSAYDAGRLLVKALTQLEGRWNGVQLVQQMKTLPLSSPRDGKLLKFDTHGDPINPEYIFRTERRGNRLVNTLIGQEPSINMDDYLKERTQHRLLLRPRLYGQARGLILLSCTYYAAFIH